MSRLVIAAIFSLTSAVNPPPETIWRPITTKSRGSTTFVGQVIDALAAQDALENTLLLVLADNGRPFPRAKTRLHDSGMKTALIAHWPAGIAKSGTASSSLVSTIDLAPTFVELAGLQSPPSFQGVSFAPVIGDPQAITRRHAFSEHNWHDYEAHGRSIRSEGWLYIRNARQTCERRTSITSRPKECCSLPCGPTARSVLRRGPLC